MAKKDERQGRDVAGVGPYARERERLVPLNQMDGWDVESGEPDIRAWEVKTVSGRILGTVRDLLVDPDAGEVIMLDVDLAGSDKHAFVPIRLVEVDRSRRFVRVDSADLEPVDGVGDREVSVARLEPRKVKYAGSTGERVVDRKPVVEETVVRRRDPEADSRLEP